MPIDALLAAIARFAARPRDGRTEVEVTDELVALRRGIDLLHLEFARDTRVFDGTDLAERMGATSAVAWVRHSCQVSGAEAARAVSVGIAEALMPESVAAMAEGAIGYGHLTHMAGTALEIGDPAAPGSFPEAPLLALARDHSVSRFQFDCAHARHAHDARRFLEQQVENEVNTRRLDITRTGDGRTRVEAIFDRTGGAAIRSALYALARRTGSDDQRPGPRRLADALIELCNHGLDAGVVPQSGGQRTHLNVTTTLETLLGLPGAPAGELDFSFPISATTVQRLACESEVVRVLLGARGEVLDVGRGHRFPPPATCRAMRVRDGGCVWPGCDRPANWTNAHHLRHWTRHHGPTDRDNMVLLCWRHHEMVHEGGWEISRHADGTVTVVPPQFPVFDDGRSLWRHSRSSGPAQAQARARAPNTDSAA